MLDAHPDENAHGWIQKAIQETRAPRFAILGSFEGSGEDEAKELGMKRCFQRFPGQYRLGAQQLLGEHLEKKIEKHLDLQLPKALQALKEELAKIDSRLESVKEYSPSAAILAVTNLVVTRWEKLRLTRETSIRKLLEALRVDIQNLELRCVSKESKNARPLNEGEIPEPGTNVWVRSPSREKHHLTLATFIRYNSPFYWVKFEDGKEDCFSLDHVYSLENPQSDVVSEILTQASTSLGLRNLAHADPQVVIELFAADFAKRYFEVHVEAVAAFRDMVVDQMEQILDKTDVPVAAEEVVEFFLREAKKILDSLVHQAEKDAEDLMMWNMPPLVFTPSEHYLDQNFRNLVANDSTTGSTDQGSATLLYYRIRAYLKVQRKVVVEAASKMLSLKFEVRFVEGFTYLFRSGQYDGLLLELVKEPPGMKEERDMLKRRKVALSQAIEQLHLAM